MTTTPNARRTRKLANYLRKERGWHQLDSSTLRHRIWHIANRRRSWYDWGHPVMELIGRANHGSYDPPRGRDMWYRNDPDSGHLVTTYSYNDLGDKPTESDWKIFDVQDDGHTIKMGYYGGGFYGLDRREQRMFLRWYLIECKLRGEWLGLRRWAYYKALHAAVQFKVPFTCQRVPSKDSGGYSHWYCQLPRKHTGPHRVHNYRWSDSRGRVEYVPESANL